MAKVAEYTEATPPTTDQKESTKPRVTKYVITTPGNPNYDQRTLGVQFVAGRGILDEALIDPRLNKSLTQIVQEFSEMSGFALEPIG